MIVAAGVVEVAAITAGLAVTPVPRVIVGAGTEAAAATVTSETVSLTLIETDGTAEVAAIEAGATETPEPCVTVTEGTAEVQAITAASC